MPSTHVRRVEFTDDHDHYLAKYLATYCPHKEGRSGRKVYQILVANQDKKWPWSVYHTCHSWRERYVKHADQFDRVIRDWQRKHDIGLEEGKTKKKQKNNKKRPIDPVAHEVQEPPAKRARGEAEDRVPSGETPTEQGAATPHARSGISMSQHPPEPHDTPTPRQTEHANVQPPAPAPDTNTPVSTHITKKPTVDPPALQTQRDTLQVIRTSPERQAPTPTNGHPPPRPVKRIKKRPRVSNDVFASTPSSPRKGGTPDDVSTPSKAGPSALGAGTPVAMSVYPRAPPRLVNSLHGQVLVDQKGRIPRMLTHKEAEEPEQSQVQWPPVRGSAIKSKRAEEDVAPRVEGERREDVQNGASPVKPPELPSGPIPKVKSPTFPAPRASTRSPFRPEAPGSEPQLRPHTTKAARDPASVRAGERKSRHSGVPSLDLVALSHSSPSAPSRSRSSVSVAASASGPARPARWSSPALVHVTPMHDASWGALSRSAPASGKSGSLVYSDLWGGRDVLTCSSDRSIAGTHVRTLSSPLSVPHPRDMPMAASHGLASMMAHMSANHGLTLGVVEAVYARVESLREADEVLGRMKEAAEEEGEREIERRERERGRGGVRTVLRYVVASEDGEGSKYSPSETSRAAMWTKQFELTNYAAEEVEEEEEVEAAVEEGGEEYGSDRDGEGVTDDMFVEQVLLDKQKAQALEKKVGRARFRSELVKRFVLHPKVV